MRCAMTLSLVVSLSTIAACSILGGDFGEYSTEDPVDAGPGSNGDGTTPALDATNAADAAIDSPSGDTGAPFCVPGAHAFCADFEEPNALSAFTANSIDPAGGIAEISSTRAKGGTKSLYASLPLRTTGKTTALQQKFINGDWRRTVVECDIFIETPAWKAGDVNASILDMGFHTASVDWTFFVVMGETYGALGGGPAPDSSGAPFDTGKWQHLKAELTTTSFSVSIDGWKRTHTFSITQDGDTPRFELALGIDGFNAPVPKFEVYYDNVTVDFPP